ncbi:carbamoyl-phosphate synthase large subunit [Erythrobacter sp. KY5]|uniref:ATP-grasp domain-containing protein n=1 Tax=Erythrobacter sp. KY5 TaxID=2011159 RepID=UPI000DBEFE69|nr:ATP-grasp domain-containing protein [Erythrobacter sp. KY5]AWW73149.1 carbamoyl-phosphate synthase large subunit [Erythrobacter sp. KY5]
MIAGPILLTGAGGDIGVSLARILREAFPDATLVGADCNPNAEGATFFDRFVALPRADSPDYLSALRNLVRESAAQVLIPLAEAELARLLEAQAIGLYFESAVMVTANERSLSVGLDKLATAQALQAAGIPSPESGIVGVDQPGDYDVIVKPRCGQGSKGLLQLRRQDFDTQTKARSGDIWQRWLKSRENEFTCGLVRFVGMPTRSLSFRRALKGGLTGSGEVVHDPRIDAVCKEVAETLDLDGAINVQLRMDGGNPTIFEINPRFSSTVGFRHRLGFQDCVWSIVNRLWLASGNYEPPAAGTLIERGEREIIRMPEAIAM